MKNALSILGTLALLIFNQSMKANQLIINQDGPGLEIESSLSYNDEKIGDYTIFIYDENQNSDTVYISKSNSIYLKLGYGHTYSIRFAKKGFRERIVMVDTNLDPSKTKRDMGFDFEIQMIRLNEPDNTLSDLPVALVRYDADQERFMYSRTYHRQVRGKEIKESEFITQ